MEVILAGTAVVVAFAAPTPEGSWSSPSTYAGGAATVGLMIAFWARGLPHRSRRPQLNDGAVLYIHPPPDSHVLRVGLALRVAATTCEPYRKHAYDEDSRMRTARRIEKGALSERGALFSCPGATELRPGLRSCRPNFAMRPLAAISLSRPLHRRPRP